MADALVLASLTFCYISYLHFKLSKLEKRINTIKRDRLEALRFLFWEYIQISERYGSYSRTLRRNPYV